MKIAIVHSFYSSKNPSGENTVVNEQVKTLRDAGHDVCLVARYTDRQEQQSAYAFRSALTVAGGWGWSPGDELEAFGPDVIHVHNTFPNFGTRWLRAWGARAVVTLHNYRTVCAAATLFRGGEQCTDCLRLPVLPAVRHGCYRSSPAASVPVAIASAPAGGLRDLLHQPSALITLNEDMASRFRRLTRTPISVVPNFVPEHPTQSDREDSWAYVGRLSSEKGIGELLSIWPRGQRLVVYGDGELGTQLRRKFIDRHDVVFRGNTDRSTLMGELSSYNGLVVPSMCAEGLPTAILEALASGVPSLVSDNVSAGPELELAGVSTRMATMKSGLVGVVDALARIRDGGEVMRERAREVHRQRYSPQAWLLQMTKIYDQVAS